MGLSERLRALFRPKTVHYDYVSAVPNLTVDGLDIAKLYATQPNLQAVVTFIADNVAQLPLKVYSRDSDTERRRITDDAVAMLFTHPNEYMTCFELVRTTMMDYCLYGRCAWLLIESADMESGFEIVPIPNRWITGYHGKNAFWPESIDVTTRDGVTEIPADRFIIFHNYDPLKPYGQVSPVRALSSILYEQIEAGRYRSDVWRNQGRLNAYITRPANVRPWTPEQAKKFKDSFGAGWTKGGGRNGAMPVLEDGMDIKAAPFNAKEAQWAESVKLSREDVSAVYHINPSLIWNTDGQTYASAKDNARALYADTLAPVLRMLQDRINAFLLPKVGARPEEYVEFDIQAKLQGSFEEQVQVMQSSVGAPWLTRNEARARNNLPPIEGGDELIVPLNVIEGGLASPTDTTRESQTYNNAGEHARVKERPEPSGIRMKSSPEQGREDAFTDVYRRFFDRQKKAILPKLGAKAEWWDADRWNRELADDLYEVAKSQSYEVALDTLASIGSETGYDFNRTENYLRTMCATRAETANGKTHDMLLEAIRDDTGGTTPASVFDRSEGRAESSGSSMAAGIAAFSILESLRQAESDGFSLSRCTKTWLTTSRNPRDSHVRMSGETVPYQERFSNGADFPQDAALDAGESCNCKCVVEVFIPD